ncbi:MAG: prepilin-type N-terminal cleavage/methylation domain-containing protein [Pseudomonadota bacterium]|nr:prepilin-type N-terminal cleavage/methylation domain-containing protein [Pseudomonadota bacterium]
MTFRKKYETFEKRRFEERERREILIMSDSGFTLIEMVIALVLVAVMTVLGGTFLLQATSGFLTVKDNTRLSQQAELAMARLGREIIEMQSMTAAGTASTLSIAHIAGNRTLGLDSGKLKINASGGPLSAGDILIENVQSFSITYWSGDPPTSSSTWPLSNDFQRLAAIDIDLQLNHPEGGMLHFASRIAPRNNKNIGGAAPPATPPPGAPPSMRCFVATAAYGGPNHPWVNILRIFRDRYLLTWWGGSMLTRAYYYHGEPAANWLRSHPNAAGVVRLLLLPFIGLAFMALYAPAGFIFLPALALILGGIGHFKRRSP